MGQCGGFHACAASLERGDGDGADAAAVLWAGSSKKASLTDVARALDVRSSRGPAIGRDVDLAIRALLRRTRRRRGRRTRGAYFPSKYPRQELATARATRAGLTRGFRERHSSIVRPRPARSRADGPGFRCVKPQPNAHTRLAQPSSKKELGAGTCGQRDVENAACPCERRCPWCS